MKDPTTRHTAPNIKWLRDKLDLSQEAFGKLFGCTRDNVASYERGSVPPMETLMKIVKHLKNVYDVHISTESLVSEDLSKRTDIDILAIKEGKKKEVKLLGKHVPLRITADQYSAAFGDWPGLPMYNTPVTATFVESYRDENTYTPQYYLHDPRFRDCDFGAIITGDSMHDEIRHGDFIACKEIKDRRFIVYGDIYYVVTSNGLETCKYLNADPEDKDNYLMVAKSRLISPSPLPKDMVVRLYKVRGIIRGY